MKNKKMKMIKLFAKCSASSTPLKCSASSNVKPISEDVLDEQRLVFCSFIEEVTAKLYLRPHSDLIKYGHWKHLADLALEVLFPGEFDILFRKGRMNENHQEEGAFFEYITEREESGMVVLMEKEFIHLLNGQKIGSMTYYDVIQKKKKMLKEEAEEKEKMKEAVDAKKKKD